MIEENDIEAVAETLRSDFITCESKVDEFESELCKFTGAKYAVALSHTNICIAEHVPHEQTQPLLDWGEARGFSTAEELWELIKNPMEHDIKQTKEKLWMPYGKQNIEAFF